MATSQIGAIAPSPAAARPTLRVRSAGYALSAPIQRAVAVPAGHSVLIAGGLDAAGTTVNGVFSLNPTSGDLRSLGSLQMAVHDAAGAMLGGRLIVFGGGASATTDAVQAVDPSTGNTSVVGRLPMPLSDLAAASVGTTAYLIGGYDGARSNPTIYATTDGHRFRPVARLPVGLRYPAVAAVDGRIVIAGGLGPGGPTTAVYSFDPAGNSVSKIGDLPAPTAHAEAIALGSAVFVAGGLNAHDAAVRRVSLIDVSTGGVFKAPPLRRQIADAAVAGIGDSALLIGGFGTGTLSTVLRASAVAPPAPPTSPTSPSPTVTAGADSASIRPFAGVLLIADRGNNRLLVVNAQKKILWEYPSPTLPAPPFRFYFPDDAFFVHGGHAILVNEEENDVIAEIAYPSGRTLWTYGHPGVPGSGRGYLHQPDDVYPYPGGGVVVADALNCRILFFGPRGNVTRQIGRTGACASGLPSTVDYPNGDTPLANGDLLVSEVNSDTIDRVDPQGRVRWSHRIPGITTPSDPQRLSDGTYLAVSYSDPGAVVRFNSAGHVLWSYRARNAAGVLDHPSLGAPLPNGLIAVNDDYNHRVVLIDPKTNRIVWQYGTGVSGGGPRRLSYPDGLDLMLPGNVLPLHVDFPSSAVKRGVP